MAVEDRQNMALNGVLVVAVVIKRLKSKAQIDTAKPELADTKTKVEKTKKIKK